MNLTLTLSKHTAVTVVAAHTFHSLASIQEDAATSLPKMSLPPIYDQRPPMVRLLRPRAPALQLGENPSRLRRPRSLTNLHEDQLSDQQWYHDARVGRILPPPRPRPHATFAMTAV